MPAKAIRQSAKRWRSIALAGLALMAWQVPQAKAADEPDLIFRRSTVFKWVSPNDKLATYGVDDPEVEGVACHFTVPEKGGFKGWLGLAEEVSDSDKLIEGSPKNSTSSVPIMPWGTDANVQKCGEFIQ
jgi:CreA protein